MNIEKAKELYATGSSEVRAALEAVVGIDVLKPTVFERVKSIEDAYVVALNINRKSAFINHPYLQAAQDMYVLCKALNEGWEPNWADTSMQKFSAYMERGIIHNRQDTEMHFLPSSCYFRTAELRNHAIQIAPEVFINYFNS